jgi:hypothetical protein
MTSDEWRVTSENEASENEAREDYGLPIVIPQASETHFPGCPNNIRMHDSDSFRLHLRPPFSRDSARRSPTRSRNSFFSKYPPLRRLASSSSRTFVDESRCDFQSICDCECQQEASGLLNAVTDLF